MAMDRYTGLEIKEHLATLNEQAIHPWEIKDGKLHNSFIFPDFANAFGFMTSVAMFAERANHHPEWSNQYNRVVIDLTTHEVQGISARDFELASKIEKLIHYRLRLEQD